MYGSESGTAVFAMFSDGLAVAGILLSIGQKPVNRVLIINVFLVLDDNLQTNL